MVKKILCQGYLWLLLLLLYAPIFIIMIYSFTEAKVLGNWTGFSTKLYSSPVCCGYTSFIDKCLGQYLEHCLYCSYRIHLAGQYYGNRHIQSSSPCP